MDKNAIKAVVAALLLVFLFAGCNKSSGAAAGQAPGGQAAGEYQLKDPNVNTDGQFPIVKEPITLTVGFAVDYRVTDYYDNALTKYYEDLTGIKLEFQLYDTGADGQTKLGLQVAAGDKLPDIIYSLGVENNARREAYGRAGAIIPLQDYIKNLGVHTQNAVAQTELAKQGFDLWLYGTDIDGNIWGYIKYDTVFSNTYSSRAWYNADFAEKLGMSEDQWTGGGGKAKIPTQEWFLKYLRGVRDSDVNGNGDPNDEIGITGQVSQLQGNMLRWLTNQYFFNDYTSTNSFWLIKDNQLYFNYDQPEYRDAMRFLNMLFKEKLFQESDITQNQATMNSLVNSKPYRVGVVAGYGSGISASDDRLIYRAMPVVEGPNGFITVSHRIPVPSFPWAISANCEHPEAAFRWLDVQGYDPDFVLYARYGEKDKDWRLAQPEEEGLYGDRFKPYLLDLSNTWASTAVNSHWRIEYGIDWTNRKSSLAWNGDPGFSEYLYGQAIMDYMLPFTPENVPMGLLHTTAENEEWAETRTNIANYVNQCLALFATGQMDPERDWDAYIKTLKDMGLDGLLAVDQAAYARTMQAFKK